MMRLLRLFRILQITYRYGLDSFVLGHERFRALRPLLRLKRRGHRGDAPRGERLRLALEALGPIFGTFGVGADDLAAMKRQWAGDNPMKRFGTAEEVARVTADV